MNIYLVRHGKTLLNTLVKNQGWIDSDLTKEGKEELVRLFENNELPTFDSVYCSDLGRAKSTLELIKPYIKLRSNISIQYAFALRERFLGSFEGDGLPRNRQKISEKEGYKDFDDYLSENSFWDFVDATKRHDPQKIAENFEEFSARVDTVVSEIKEQKAENILVISHANTVRYIIESLTQKALDFEVTNGKIIKVSLNESMWVRD